MKNNRFFGRAPQAAEVKSTHKPFAMVRTGADSAEITLYGDIVNARPVDWWTGEPIEGQYIILSEFLDELAKVSDVAQLTVRIHSAGGNAYDAMTIHNRLKALDAEVTVIVDGVAMSGGSLIMCAGDKVQVFPGSLVMIHKCWVTLFGGYNADELRTTAESNDAVDRSQAAIYAAKTGFSIDEILDMMSAETYMTGQEAVEKGFADELIEGDGVEVAASADRRVLFAGAVPVWTSTRKGGIPAAIPTVKPEVETSVMANITPVEAGKGGNSPMTIEELRAQHPDLYAQVVEEARGEAAPNAGNPSAPAAQTPTPSAPPVANPDGSDPVAAERQRIQEIDAVAHLFDAETVAQAKYGDGAGIQPCTAQEMAYRAAQKAAQNGSQFLAALNADNKASGAQDVGAAPDPGEPNPEDPENVAAAAKNAVDRYKMMKEGKKNV